jgi:hypothetical protein
MQGQGKLDPFPSFQRKLESLFLHGVGKEEVGFQLSLE